MDVSAKDIMTFCDAHFCNDKDCPLSKDEECVLKNIPAYWREEDINKIAEWTIYRILTN